MGTTHSACRYNPLAVGQGLDDEPKSKLWFWFWLLSIFKTLQSKKTNQCAVPGIVKVPWILHAVWSLKTPPIIQSSEHIWPSIVYKSRCRLDKSAGIFLKATLLHVPSLQAPEEMNLGALKGNSNLLKGCNWIPQPCDYHPALDPNLQQRENDCYLALGADFILWETTFFNVW